ncbi:MAG TPA: hypothetical protein PKC23_03800 [Candidatus Desulfobacillus sp.]|nr:hypothetical protein [Candidatus Desulfobacillus sp.]
MADKRLLYLDGSTLAALLWQGGALCEEGRFAADENGLAAFAEYLSRQRGSLFHLLADTVEEAFQMETLPYTTGRDRSALLTRKLGQYFYGSSLSVAISCGRQKTGRKDEQFLLTAFTRPQLFEPWLGVLGGAQAQLAGIWSLPQLGAALLGKLRQDRPRCLLVAQTQGGIRQSFYENGQLRFSRLSPTTASSAAQVAAGCAAEAWKIHQYLLGQRLIARGTPLPVLILAHPAHMGSFAEHCRSTEELQVTLLDLHAAAGQLKLKTLPKDSRSEALFLHLLALDPPRDQFAPAKERHFFRLWQIRAWLIRGGALALLGCLLFAGRELMGAYDARSKAASLLQQSEDDRQKYQAIRETYPPMPTSTENLRAVIDRFEQLEKRAAPLEASWLAISRALDDTPRVDIERIQWLLGTSPEGAQAAAAEARQPQPAGSADGALYATAIVHGTLPASMAADQRGQLETVNAFVEALRRNEGLNVSVHRMPFDIESGKSLKSSGDAGQAAAQPRFVLQLSRKL